MIQPFWGCQITRTETTILQSHISGFYQFLVAGPRAQVVHDVEKAEAARQDVCDFVQAFCHSYLLACPYEEFHEFFSDKVEVITSAVEEEIFGVGGGHLL